MASSINRVLQYAEMFFLTKFFQVYAVGVDSMRSSMVGRSYLANRQTTKYMGLNGVSTKLPDTKLT